MIFDFSFLFVTPGIFTTWGLKINNKINNDNQDGVYGAVTVLQALQDFNLIMPAIAFAHYYALNYMN